MAQVAIPELWRRDVCAVLATEASGTLIEWTFDATTRFESDSGFSWPYEAYQALRSFLSGASPMGCLVTMAKPSGETYEFYFAFKRTRFYGKILLRPDSERVVIFSAHRPLKPKLSCE
jgi:hypothetical protein